MKNILYGITVLTLMVSACQDAPRADEAKTTEAQVVAPKAVTGSGYIADPLKSTIKWIGTKPVGQHHGTVRLVDGSLAVSGNTIESGSFVIDLQSLQAYDDDGSVNTKLQGHLKGKDFFDVAQYGMAIFEITNVQEGVPADKVLVMKGATHTVTGNLKIKGINKSISFPAKIDMGGGTLLADADFNIDRTFWGLTYGNDKSLGDKFINPEVNVNIHLEAHK